LRHIGVSSNSGRQKRRRRAGYSEAINLYHAEKYRGSDRGVRKVNLSLVGTPLAHIISEQLLDNDFDKRGHSPALGDGDQTERFIGRSRSALATAEERRISAKPLNITAKREKVPGATFKSDPGLARARTTGDNATAISGLENT
jgi:hypothetical protein